jgi:cysteine synthase
MSGNTPLVRINSLSNALGVEILGKAEVSYVSML